PFPQHPARGSGGYQISRLDSIASARPVGRGAPDPREGQASEVASGIGGGIGVAGGMSECPLRRANVTAVCAVAARSRIDGANRAEHGLSRFITSTSLRPTEGLRAAKVTASRYRWNNRRVREFGPLVPGRTTSVDTDSLQASC